MPTMAAAGSKKTPIAVYFRPKMLALLALGFSSGLPLALSASMLFVWMREAGVDLESIGLFTALGTPYTIKFLWSPLIDNLRLPFLTKTFGRRRGWILFSQALLIAALLFLGHTSPAINPGMTALAAFMVAFFSATQDIVIDAFRVEKLERHEQGAGAAVLVYGYRLGMLASSAGALYLASSYDWSTTYAAMAGLVLIGSAAALLSSEPDGRIERAKAKFRSAGAWLKHAVADPFADFITRHGWWLILIFIVLFKLGDALAGVMTSPFLIDVGFTKIEIANVVKVFGLAATLLGLAAGGALMAKAGLFRALLITAVLQLVSNFMFAVLAIVGHSIPLLAATIGFENLASGMGTAVFVAYISLLTNVKFTATQYALFSSFAVFGRTWLSASSGFFAEALGWAPFFIATTVAAAPGIVLLFVLKRFDAREREKKVFA